MHNYNSFYFIVLQIFSPAYIIEGSLVAHQIRYVAGRCPRKQFQTLISQQIQIEFKFKEFGNLSVEKKTLPTALEF